MKVTTKELTREQLNTVKLLADSTDILETTARILFNRGINTPEKVKRFLHPSINNFNNPFLLSGMAEAVERIKTAKTNGETVVVYGDYDVDGICATTILYRALKIFGIDAYTVIPERENGYGLSEGVLNEVLESAYPDLIITVDCGISGKNEVEYLKDLGVDVIVTDHHEIPEELPDCVTVNCKLKNQEYPFDCLCGAGVSYKLAYALIGDDANSFLDLVALATIADSMPLVDENRDIVYEGIERIKRGQTCRAVKNLLEIAAVKEITATSLAFSVVPRVNAAGRMGNARLGLELFILDDESEILEICRQLVAYNVDRQTECDMFYKEAKRSLYGVKVRKVIVCSGNAWKSGLVGIVTAKISEEYNLPAILFSEKDGVLHGSARSIDGVNIFETISSAKDLLIDFGGHSQAAGVTLLKENLQAFSDRVNDYVESHYAEEVFEKTVEAEEIITSKFSMRLAKELALLEPCGTGNRKPLFAVNGKSLNASRIKPDSPHVSIGGIAIDLMYFGGAESLEILQADAEKTIVFEPNLSVFNHREYLKGFVKWVVCNGDSGQDTYVRALARAFNTVIFKNYDDAVKTDLNGIKTVLANEKPSGYGTLFVITNPKNKALFPRINDYSVNVLKLNERGGKNCVIVGGIPENDDLSAYDKLVYLDTPVCVEKYVNFKSVIVNTETPSFNLDGLSTDRAVFGSVFKNIIALCSSGAMRSLYEIFKNVDSGYSVEQFVFCATVFCELEFLTFNGVYTVNTKTKKELSTSAIYSAISKRN